MSDKFNERIFCGQVVRHDGSRNMTLRCGDRHSERDSNKKDPFVLKDFQAICGDCAEHLSILIEDTIK